MELNPIQKEINSVKFKSEKNSIKITGSIDNPKKCQSLETFFIKIHAEIIRKKLKKIYVDISELDFLNSSGIREFVEWILNSNDLADEKKYHIIFICNPDLLWQESSISTLIYLNPDYISKVFNKEFEA